MREWRSDVIEDATVLPGIEALDVNLFNADMEHIVRASTMGAIPKK